MKKLIEKNLKLILDTILVDIEDYNFDNFGILGYDSFGDLSIGDGILYVSFRDDRNFDLEGGEGEVESIEIEGQEIFYLIQSI